MRRPPSDKLELILESILFAAANPVPVADIATALSVNVATIEAKLDDLSSSCEKRGVRLQRDNGTVQLVTAPEAAPYILRLFGPDKRGKLSQAALETLAIIAYRQPVTRAQVEVIRGTNCAQAIATLKERDLVAEIGRAAGKGHPYLLGTTAHFLEYFGLKSAEDLVVPSQPSGEE